MKLKIIIFALAAMLIIAGCAGPKSGVSTSGTEKIFASAKEAYDSGLSLKCGATAGVTTMNMYFSNKNIKTEGIGPAQTTYTLLTADNRYYVWANPPLPGKAMISLSGDSVDQSRYALLNAPLGPQIPCTEQEIDPSFFEPPK